LWERGKKKQIKGDTPSNPRPFAAEGGLRVNSGEVPLDSPLSKF
jgi:hypothetical protein